MEKYDYREAVTEEIVEYIKQDFDLKDYAGRREALKDDVKENVAMEVSRSYVGSYVMRQQQEEIWRATKNCF